MKYAEKTWKTIQKKQAAVVDKAQQEMLAFIEAAGGYTEVDFDAAIAKAYQLATKYGEANASLAALLYDTTAELSGAAVPAAEVAATATVDEVKKAIYASSEFSQNNEYISGVVGRFVKQASADTTLQNARRDGAEWAWINDGESCALCELLASEGWQHASKAVMNGNHAEHIHANCKCIFLIRFNDDTSVANYKPNENLYEETEGRTLEEKVNTIRRENYAANKKEINAQKRIAYAKRTEELNSSAAEEEPDGQFGNTNLPIK